MKELITLSILEFICIIFLLLKNNRLQTELDFECSAELAESREYADWLEQKLKEQMPRQ